MTNRTRHALAALVSVSFAAAVPVPPASASPDFFSRFEGSWEGDGRAQRELDSTPRKVSCEATGTGGAQTISIAGTCTALMIFSREIGADIAHDPESGRYTGVFRGSRAGPAQLSGVREGDALRLTVTWPKEVNGDRTAEMIVRNAGAGQFTLVVQDEAPGTREMVKTTELDFSRQ